MSTSTSRLGGMIAAAALLGAAAAAGPVASPADAAGRAGACAKGEGITVVVQDPTRKIVRCGIGDSTTGAQALKKAGFSIDYREPGFICRIGYAGKWFPGGKLTDDKPCVEFPKSGGYIYWSYWHAKNPTAPWVYSQWGVLNRNPALGSIEGWRWGTGKARPNNGVVPKYVVKRATARASAGVGAALSTDPATGETS